MEQIIKGLQDIQKDLVGAVLPVMITAIVSLVTLTVNTLVKIIIENNKYNRSQYEIMQKLYHGLKTKLMKLKVATSAIEQNNLYSTMKNAVFCYIDYQNDEGTYRENHKEQMEDIDEFIFAIDNYFQKLKELSDFLLDCSIPAIPIYHFIIKIRAKRMLIVLHYFSFVISQYISGEVDNITMKNELSNFAKDKKQLDGKKLQTYITLLDKWFSKY